MAGMALVLAMRFYPRAIEACQKAAKRAALLQSIDSCKAQVCQINNVFFLVFGFCFFSGLFFHKLTLPGSFSL